MKVHIHIHSVYIQMQFRALDGWKKKKKERFNTHQLAFNSLLPIPVILLAVTRGYTPENPENKSPFYPPPLFPDHF